MTITYRENYVILNSNRYGVAELGRLEAMWAHYYKPRLRSNVMAYLALIWARSTL